MATKIKVIVCHSFYGCDTGCCGHVVTFPDETTQFEFLHPYGDDRRQWAIEFAQDAVREKYGADHVADLDWDECEIMDD